MSHQVIEERCISGPMRDEALKALVRRHWDRRDSALTYAGTAAQDDASGWKNARSRRLQTILRDRFGRRSEEPRWKPREVGRSAPSDVSVPISRLGTAWGATTANVGDVGDGLSGPSIAGRRMAESRSQQPLPHPIPPPPLRLDQLLVQGDGLVPRVQHRRDPPLLGEGRNGQRHTFGRLNSQTEPSDSIGSTSELLSYFRKPHQMSEKAP